MNKKNNRLPKEKPYKRFTNRSENEYDLESNLHKVRSYSNGGKSKSRNRLGITDTLEDNNPKQDSRHVQEDIDISPHTYSGGISWDSYVRLDDKISVFDEKNNKAHAELRKELESKIKDIESSYSAKYDSLDTKIEHRISRDTFYWVLGGLLAILVVIVSIWWVLSYSDVHKVPREIQRIDSKIQNLEKIYSIEVIDSTDNTN